MNDGLTGDPLVVQFVESHMGRGVPAHGAAVLSRLLRGVGFGLRSFSILGSRAGSGVGGLGSAPPSDIVLGILPDLASKLPLLLDGTCTP